MNFIQEKLQLAKLKAAASMPQIADGDRLDDPVWEVRERPNGIYAMFRDGAYHKTASTRSKSVAEERLELYLLQDTAKKKRIVDARFADAVEVIDYHLRNYPDDNARTQTNVECCLKLVKPFVKGLRLQDLDKDWLTEVRREMLRDYKYSYFYTCISHFITAIYGYCADKLSAPALCFPRPAAPTGRDRVLSPEELERILRWADGEETYDPAAGTWSLPVKKRRSHTDVPRAEAAEANRREMIGRWVRLGIPTGTRPGISEGLSYGINPDYAYVDLENGILSRLPAGASAEDRKRAPAVALPPSMLAMIADWKERDGGQTHIMRTVAGGPLKLCSLQRYFQKAMKELGIEGVSLHVLRHTAITWMVQRGLSATVISAICGISLEVLRDRYDHSDDRIVQTLGHGVMAAMLP